MPNTDSFGLVSNIISFKPEANILMFSMNAEIIYAKKYLHLGAKGYLGKASSEEEIKLRLIKAQHGLDSNWFAEVRPTINVFSKREVFRIINIWGQDIFLIEKKIFYPK